jgi:DNA-binding HxlR family transcriptional regulator
MTDDDGHTVRDILKHLTNRWAQWLLTELACSQTPLRFSELQRAR